MARGCLVYDDDASSARSNLLRRNVLLLGRFSRPQPSWRLRMIGFIARNEARSQASRRIFVSLPPPEEESYRRGMPGMLLATWLKRRRRVASW